MKTERGLYRVLWINGRDTADRRASGQTRDGRALTAPDEQDWLLYLSR